MEKVKANTKGDVLKKITRRNAVLLSLCTLFSSYAEISASEPILSLKYPKSLDYCSLSESFMRNLIRLFKADVFIESGTFYGVTAERAARCFKEVHTIELSQPLYQRAKEHFSSYTNMHLYCGDSIQILPELLKHITGKIVFWLDGHYNFGGYPTAKGDNNTAIMGELRAIQKSGIKDAIIVIDDMCYFQPLEDRPENDCIQGYPLVTEVEEAILAIDPGYRFYIFGDIGIAYPSRDNVVASPVVQACTTSRFAQAANLSSDAIAQAESIIAHAQEEELSAFEILCGQCARNITENKIAGHYFLWQALALQYRGNIQEARRYELLANSVGIYKH